MIIRSIRWTFAAVTIALSLASSAVGAQETHPSIAEIIDGFRNLTPIPMTPKSTLILGGIADHLLTRCSNDLSLSTAERLRLADFVSTAATRAAIGGRYSDPDLGRGIGDQMGGMAVYATGGQMVQGVPCGEDASGFLKHIVSSVNAQRDEGGRFVSTCTPVHGVTKCQCLAEIGQSVFPGFQSAEYSRDAVYGVIQANPFLGLMVAGKCGIVNY